MLTHEPVEMEPVVSNALTSFVYETIALLLSYTGRNYGLIVRSDPMLKRFANQSLNQRGVSSD